MPPRHEGAATGSCERGGSSHNSKTVLSTVPFGPPRGTRTLVSPARRLDEVNGTERGNSSFWGKRTVQLLA